MVDEATRRSANSEAADPFLCKAVDDAAWEDWEEGAFLAHSDYYLDVSKWVTRNSTRDDHHQLREMHKADVVSAKFVPESDSLPVL